MGGRGPAAPAPQRARWPLAGRKDLKALVGLSQPFAGDSRRSEKGFSQEDSSTYPTLARLLVIVLLKYMFLYLGATHLMY
jgi:hypothetical protein